MTRDSKKRRGENGKNLDAVHNYCKELDDPHDIMRSGFALISWDPPDGHHRL